MAKPQYPSEKLDQYMLRMPDGMRDRIKAAAEANNRSMNAEIVATLEDAYPAPFQYDDINHHLSDTIERADLLRREILQCQDAIEKAKDIKELSALFERHRALSIVDRQVHVELMGIYKQIGDGYGDGDGPYGDSDGNGDGMGGSPDGGVIGGDPASPSKRQKNS